MNKNKTPFQIKTLEHNIMIFVGPPASGKSTFARKIKDAVIYDDLIKGEERTTKSYIEYYLSRKLDTEDNRDFIFITNDEYVANNLEKTINEIIEKKKIANRVKVPEGKDITLKFTPVELDIINHVFDGEKFYNLMDGHPIVCTDDEDPALEVYKEAHASLLTKIFKVNK